MRKEVSGDGRQDESLRFHEQFQFYAGFVTGTSCWPSSLARRFKGRCLVSQTLAWCEPSHARRNRRP
jgi:hypothetical protein